MILAAAPQVASGSRADPGPWPQHPDLDTYVVGDGPTAADRRQAIDAALTAPFTAQGLRVEYTTQAASAWRRAVFLDAALVPAYLALAEAYDRLSQPALAVQALQTGLTTLSDSPELRDRLARLTPAR